jgi:acetyl-CoA carboxylase carboxyltransferase component
MQGSESGDAAATVRRRHELLLDANRPDAVAKQHKRGKLTARERITALLDSGGEFVEYGALARPILPELEAPAEGVVVGTGPVNGFTTAIISYDYTALGGSQGPLGHQKVDRILGVATQRHCPVVLIAEGGGARAQEMAILHSHTDDFRKLARLSGRVPVVGIAPGRAFAGHANLLGMTDIIIAVRDAAIGIAGPPLVKGAMGVDLTPEEIGRVDIHERAGTVDVTVEDDHDALESARYYLDLLSHPVVDHPFEDARSLPDALRRVVPANARQAFDVRALIELLVDEGSILELRPRFAGNAVTALARLGGRSIGVVANNSAVYAGAIDSNAADKMTRFLRLCDAFGLPLLFLCDSPGFLVGPQAEEQALIRHSTRMLFALAAATVPILSIVVRRAFGLAYYVMGSPSWDPLFSALWPGAEYGTMGLSGGASIVSTSSASRDDGRTQTEILDELSAFGSAFAMAERLQTDDVIDPGETRSILRRVLAEAPVRTTDERWYPIEPW